MKRNLKRWLIFAGIPAMLAAVAAVVLLWDPLELFAVAVPRPREVVVARLGMGDWTQGWPVAKTRRFHHTSQGTKILPIAWFKALEPPGINPLASGERLASRKYLSRFGFLYDPSEGAEGEEADDLPIGFAIEDNFLAPYLNPPVAVKTKVVGLTCAACHTGRLDVEVGGGKTVGVLIEGGSAMINLGKFQEAVGKSLGMTLLLPDGRFQRFARRVLADPDCPPDEMDGADDAANVATIRRHVAAYVETGIAGQDYAREHKLYPIDGGFSRTDALALIGNRVFGLSNVDNQTVTDAPVNFPHLWDTPWFDWVQYNASIRLPLARNIGEALGVGAAVKTSSTLEGHYESTVRIDNLDWMETLLGGDTPLAAPGAGSEMLQPPRWDDFRAAIRRAGQLDADSPLLKPFEAGDPDGRGKALYATHCRGCHLPPRDELRRELAVNNSPYWEEDLRSKKKFLKLRVIDLSTIGTDQNQAVNFYRRFAVVPNPLNVKTAGNGDGKPAEYAPAVYPLSGSTQTISAEEGLYRVTSFLRKEFFNAPARKFFDAEHAADRLRYDRYRTLPMAKGPEQLLNDAESIVLNRSIDDVIRANLGYKARPLDGIWATPPYFHNGSVPNLYQVLIPADNRARQFYLGRTDFDPIKVGYLTDQFPGGFLMDTSLTGNSNGGHEYRNYSLEEFEKALKIKPAAAATREDRWQEVFRLSGISAPVGEEARWNAAKQLTDMLLEEIRTGARHHIQDPNFMGIRGVLGSELTEDERWALIAYLKTL